MNTPSPISTSPRPPMQLAAVVREPLREQQHGRSYRIACWIQDVRMAQRPREMHFIDLRV